MELLFSITTASIDNPPQQINNKQGRVYGFGPRLCLIVAFVFVILLEI